MRVVYICNTVYHLMMAAVRLDESAENHLVLMDTIPDFEYFAQKAQEMDLFSGVRAVESDIFKIEGKYPEDFRKKWSDYFGQFDKIGIFNDDTYISHFIFQQGYKYWLFEDGFNYFQYPFDAIAYWEECSEWKPEYKFMITKGWSETCERIEVNEINGTPDDIRREKMIEVPQRELFAKITDRKRQFLAEVFSFKIDKIAKNTTLVLTQPLFADGVMKTSEEQRKFFEDICRKYTRFFKKVYLKPHPRDNVEYSPMKNVIIIPKNIPVEIFAMIDPNFRFKRGVTHSSTAMEFADYIDKKIILEDLRNV